jgi:hypothetical protein
LQTAQGDTQAKVCKRACFFQRTTEKTKKSFHASQKIKSADTPSPIDKDERKKKPQLPTRVTVAQLTKL